MFVRDLLETKEPVYKNVIYDKYLSIFHDYVYNKLNILQHLAKSRLTAKQFETYKTTTHFFSFFI